MENLTNVLAAFDAGKLPSQKQLETLLDFLKQNVLVQITDNTGGSLALSPRGRILARCVGEVLDAYNALGMNKNEDDIVQEAIWHLSQGDINASSLDTSTDVDTEEALNDSKAMQHSLRTLIQIVWSSISSESSELLRNFSSFARLALADAAEAVEGGASQAKTALREVDGEFQDGQRDALGRDKQTLQKEEDVKVKFEHTMTTVKGAGVSTISVAEEASGKTEDMANWTSDKLRDAFSKICKRAQNDKEYHDSLTTMIDIVEKWLTRTGEAINTNDVDTLIYDPTPEQHVSKALHGLKTFAERLAGNKSLDDLYTSGRKCAMHVQDDENLRTWYHDLFFVIRRNLNESDFVKSEEFKKTRKDLRVRWKRFFNDDSAWKEEWRQLKGHFDEFELALRQDKDLNRLREVHGKLGQAVEKGMTEGAQTTAQSGLQAAMEQASWFWRDIFQVYMPKALAMMKDLPIPRTEYVDDDMEFVMENLDISSFQVNPAHVFIRNITDIDIRTSDTNTPAFGALTHIRIQAVQLALDKVSFFYKDKRATVGPSHFSGLLTFTLPPHGIDIDVKLRLIPAQRVASLKRSGSKDTYEIDERELRHAFHNVELAQVEISSDIDLQITKSNHAMLLSVFKPIFTMRFRDAMERALSEQMRSVIERSDGLAWDVSKRAEMFRDTGLGSGGAFAAAVWSELGRLRRGGSWHVEGTGTGVVVEGENGKSFAVGAEPQILSGKKRGPIGTASRPLEERFRGVKKEAGLSPSTGKDVNGLKKQAEDAVQQEKKVVQSFKQTVEHKSEREKAKSGWRTSAFDINV